ncbi:radical SAM family heme chaperone HemW [Anaeromyxobacter dehalogenans]|uniref:Heme chaperone HemW n=1 Tax=Anaeromyxobacter dehalogenans (strain 2CP-C) TaxID=290397 RepID=Q2IMI8_ANADE|nr:radical SAM family heme chaperone HemW [Anaeromyxobacter dehalogenans]ABC80018.1 coproporphyrinogen III oxidase, anaerobic [Anaeromyxobacter dehalogenans 2CP-C]
MARPFGVYVHYPYCTHRCPYCDFAVTTERPPGAGRYARAVRAELGLRAAAFEGLALRSVYLGGGTPSLWDAEEIRDVLDAIRGRFGLAAEAEVTLEVNPESSDPARLEAWRAAGVNRISVGVQSFDPGVLAKLGRRHGPERAERAIREASAAIGNVSVDLIYGARRSSVETARRDAERAVEAGAAHVSAYALTLEPDVMAEEVPLARMRREGRLPLPSDEDTLAQAAALRAALRRLGLRRYEISNFARPGRESVHNGLYWRHESYLGLGAGAYGCRRGEAGSVRYGNLRDAGAWLAAVEAGRLPTAEEDRIDARADRNERLMLALRTREGAPLAALGPAQAREAADLVRHRLAVRRDGALVLTRRGLDLHSAISERLFE